MKRVYINDECVVVGNRVEGKFFVFNRKSMREFEINSDMFDILRKVKSNKISYNKLVKVMGNDTIDYLLRYEIFTYKKPTCDSNVREVKGVNTARLFIEITNKCNLNCKHCYGGFSSQNNEKLYIKDLKKMIDRSKKSGLYQFDLTGGEPLLYPEIEEFLSYAYKSGVLVRIFSNLTVFNERFLKMFAKYGVREIVTSVDSCHAKCHDDFRGAKNSFEKTLSAIKTLKENNFNVSVNTMIGKHNESYIDELVEFIDGLKVKSVLDVIIPEGRAVELKESVEKSAEIIKNIYEKHYNIIDKNAISINCGIGDRFVYIKSNGKIYICPSLIGAEYEVGNIKYFSIKKIWRSLGKFGNLVCSHRNETCGSCSGGCRARALHLHGDMEGRDDVYCIVNGVVKK